jgi:hypothetical protein
MDKRLPTIERLSLERGATAVALGAVPLPALARDGWPGGRISKKSGTLRRKRGAFLVWNGLRTAKTFRHLHVAYLPVSKLRAVAGEHSEIVPDAPRQKLLQVHCRALTERLSILRYPRIAGLAP